MGRAAARRAAAAGLEDRIDVVRLGLHELGRLGGTRVRAAFSDLGPLNCAGEIEPVAAALAALVEPGGRFVASVMGRLCPWEIARHLATGEARRAFVRFSRGPVAVPLGEHVVWTRYYWPREFARAFAAAGFELVSVRSLGLFLPPPPLAAFARRHPALTATLEWLDDRVGTWPLARSAGDHFLIVMRR
jgi:hypothetical protein